MKPVAALLLIVLIFLACQKSTLSDPNNLEGDYITNGIFDISCVSVPPGNLPTLKVTKSGHETYDLTITHYLPSKTNTEISGVKLLQEDGSDKLVYQNKNAGSWKKIEGLGDQKILTISIQVDPTQFIYFAGVEK